MGPGNKLGPGELNSSYLEIIL